MISLFGRKKSTSLQPVKLPPHCVPGIEAESLAVKREAQLRWMHEHGVEYLGNPAVRAAGQKTSQDQSPETSPRVVGIRSLSPQTGQSRRRVDAA
jgi:hypothetical protein